MIKQVKEYIKAKKEFEKIQKNGMASFMDVRVRDDRMEKARSKAVTALGKIELAKIMQEENHD